MILVGIDIGKKQYPFSIIDKQTGEILSNPSVFPNNQEGFLLLMRKLISYANSELLIDMEDTRHFHFALLKYLLDRHYTVALITPTTTDLTKKLQGDITKNDPLAFLTICDVIGSNQRKKPYRITKANRFDLYEQKQLTHHHHNLKEELNIYKNLLQKCIDIVFPELNSLFHSKYGIVYMNVLRTLLLLKRLQTPIFEPSGNVLNMKDVENESNFLPNSLKQHPKLLLLKKFRSDTLYVRLK